MTDNSIGAHLAVITDLLTTPDLATLIRTVLTRSLFVSSGTAAGVVTFYGDGIAGVVGSYSTVDGLPDDELFLLPGGTSASENAVVIIDDTLAPAPRWQACSEVAVRHGVRGLRAFPVRIDGEAVGALVVCTGDVWTSASDSGQLRDSTVLQIMADLVGAAIMLSASTGGAGHRSRMLSTFAETTAIYHQATGILAERTALSIGDATDLLHTRARNQSVTADALARAIVRGEEPDLDRLG